MNFSVQQMDAFKESMKQFEVVRYNVLLAQMQSGKTDTYHLIACEMLRLGMVEKVIIYSGNREVELLQQLSNKSMEQFYIKYGEYLENKEISRKDERLILAKVKTQIQVIWGSKLKSSVDFIPKEKVLFIWEESHYAQTKEQHPFQFMEEIGIEINGDKKWFEKNQHYFLSVSATPFSELVNLKTENHSKKVIYLKPGENYQSVKKWKEKGNIISFEEWEEGLDNALKTNGKKEKLGYGLVRVSGTKIDDAIDICQENNWDYELYDQMSERKNINEILKETPTKNKIIFLKGLCRMGKQIIKDNILFCLETTQKPKTDTLVQGLLGRCCGYHSFSDILIYMNQKIIESEELDRFIKMYEDNVSTIPYKGANIKAPLPPILTNKMGLYPIIPDKIFISEKGKELKKVLKELYLDDSSKIESFNDENQKKDIKQLLQEETTKITIHKLKKETILYTRFYPKIISSIETKRQTIIGKSEVDIWIHEDGYVYLTCCVKSPPDDLKITTLPRTTQKEVFYY